MNEKAGPVRRASSGCLKSSSCGFYNHGMSKSLEADYRKSFVFPPHLEDWVGKDHPARFVRELVESLDLEELGLTAEFSAKEAGMGRPHYSSSLLLKAWLYAYMNRVRSTRTLERQCRQDVGLIWLLGMLEPDHNTLWRFWKSYKKALRKVFRQVVRIGFEANLLGVVLHALDGTKIPSRGTSKRSQHLYRKNLTKWLEKVEQELKQMEGEIEGEGAGETSYRLPEELKSREELRKVIQEALEKLDEGGKNQLSLTDPESQMMPCGQSKRKKFGYNAQVVVDSESGLIVAAEVVDETTDNAQLLPMLDQTQENLGRVAEDTVADAGYRGDANIGEAARKNYSVLVQLDKSEGEEAGRFHSSRFQYDSEKDCCLCPLGQPLEYRGDSKGKHGEIQRRYHCQASQCGCSASPRKRTIYIGPYHAAVVEHRNRQTREEEKTKLNKRGMIVEPVFGQLKQNEGFWRWTHFGLENVRTQWTLLCTAHNLKKLFRNWVNGRLPLPTP